jgi:predicted metal-dependent HD superfamily phosphohydrolase
MKTGSIRNLMLNRWLRFTESMGSIGIEVGSNPELLFHELDHCYGEEHRCYHNWSHISNCLDEFQSAHFLARHPTAVELALWYHDMIYTPGAQDNEELSARAARDAAVRLGFPYETAQEVEALVLATRYLTDDRNQNELCKQDSALIRDIDLSILGKTPEQFDDYEQAIAAEYDFLPPGERQLRRIRILERFLELPKIYEHQHFQKSYEEQARRNLSRSISRLRQLLGE